MSGAQLEGIFDPSQIAPTMGGGQSLPVSDKNGHLVIITESEMKQTTSGTGTMLALTCQIQDGPHRGSEGHWNLNLGNANATTVRIAQQELACICHAVGYVQALQNTEVLHNKPFRVVVELQKGADAAEKGYTNVTKVLRADGSKLTDKPGTASQGAAPSLPSSSPGPTQAPAGFPPAAQQTQQAPVATVQPQQTQFPVSDTVQPQQQQQMQQMQQPPQQWQQPQQQQQMQQMQQPPQQQFQQPQQMQQPAPATGQGVPWGAPPAQ